MDTSVIEDTGLERARAFWDRLADVRAGMLGLDVAHRMVPMTHYADKGESTLWFIAADGAEIVETVKAGPRAAHYVLASAREGLYANVVGELSLDTNQMKLDELWNAVADSWFEGGRRDPDVQLLKFRLREAEVWSTTTNSLSFAYEIAKAKVSDEKPDVGENYVLTF